MQDSFSDDPDFILEEAYLDKTLSTIKTRHLKMQKEVDDLEKAYEAGLKEIAIEHHIDTKADMTKQLNQMMKQRGYKFKKHESSILKSSYLVPYFARLDFQIDNSAMTNPYYIGKHAVYDDARKLLVVDWRSPLASLYYNYSEPTKNAKYEFEREHAYQPWIKEKKVVSGNLHLRRNFDIESSKLLSVYDNSLRIDLLTRSLNKKKGGVLEDIVSTIQEVQNQIIREDPEHICIVQGTAGSGKTTIAMHRISYLFYNYKDKIKDNNTLLLTTSNVLVNYMSKTLPELEVFDITQDTLSGLIRKLLKKGKINLMGYKIIEEKAHNSSQLNSLSFISDFNYAIDIFTDSIKNQILRHKYYNELDISRLVTRIENKQVFEFINNILEYLSDYHSDVKVLIKDGRYTLEYLNVFISEFINYLENIVKSFDYVKFVSDYYSSRGITSQINNKILYLDDISAIFYLYVKINGTLSELGSYKQIIVDEGQDLGLLNYLVIKTLSNQKGLTIMGDLNQSVTDNGTINDWTDLESIFDKEIKYFNIKYSYRTTRQIASFAGKILTNFNDFKYLPKPFDRDGSNVQIEIFSNYDTLLSSMALKIREDRNFGDLKSVGIIESDSRRVYETFNRLKMLIPEIVLIDEKFDTFESDKIYLVPEKLVKGLEFSTVYILDPNEKTFEFSKESAKKLFICATRAINFLYIYSINPLTKLLSFEKIH